MIVDKKLIQETIEALKQAEAVNFPIDPRAIGAMHANCMMARIFLEVALKWNESASIADRNWIEAKERAEATDFISTLE